MSTLERSNKSSGSKSDTLYGASLPQFGDHNVRPLLLPDGCCEALRLPGADLMNQGERRERREHAARRGCGGSMLSPWIWVFGQTRSY